MVTGIKATAKDSENDLNEERQRVVCKKKDRPIRDVLL